MVLSISFGAADIQFSVIWDAIFHFNPDVTQHQIIQEVHLPRLLGGAMVGASLAVAGAIMQGMTLNPLADSSILGLNSGAGFALALCFAFSPGLPFMYLILYSFLGAGLGAALSGMLSALSEGIALYFKVGQDMAFWYAGGVAGTIWLGGLSLGHSVLGCIGQLAGRFC